MADASSDESLTLVITETSDFHGTALEHVVLRPVPIPEVIILTITETSDWDVE
jgi:hypothetical protein